MNPSGFSLEMKFCLSSGLASSGSLAVSVSPTIIAFFKRLISCFFSISQQRN